MGIASKLPRINSRRKIVLLCFALILLGLAVAESNVLIVPSATDVSINGLHFDDTGYGRSYARNLQYERGMETSLSFPANSFQSGSFEFRILGYNDSISVGIAKLKSDYRFRHSSSRDQVLQCEPKRDQWLASRCWRNSVG